MTRSQRGDVTADFQAALAEIDGPPEPELLPVRLAKACAAVLPADGVGVSLYDGDFRVPLGASDDLAALAERLQFTTGEGPCMAAGVDHRATVSARDQLARDWPRFAEQLFERTPFRAVLSMPLAIASRTHAAIDLFLVDDQQLDRISLARSSRVADEMRAALGRIIDPAGSPHPALDEQVTWLQSPSARARSIVWVAMGILMTTFDLVALDALALLRSYAFAHDALLDDAAADLVAGRLSIHQLRP